MDVEPVIAYNHFDDFVDDPGSTGACPAKMHPLSSSEHAGSLFTNDFAHRRIVSHLCVL